MRYSENYELNLVEGSDIVNPLVQDVPNYEAIDAAMFKNKEHSVGVATELKTGTVHALTRQNEDAAVFRFTATSDYTVGDTFEVDGVQVSALLVDGTTLPNRCYIIGSEVLASLKGTLLTVYANRTTASDSDKLGGQLPAYYATDADLDALENVVDAHTDQITQINSNLTEKRGFYFGDATKHLTNALDVNLNDTFDARNSCGYCTVNDTGVPSDFQSGMREVFRRSGSHVMVRLTGLATDNTIGIWVNYYLNNTWLGWKKFN